MIRWQIIFNSTIICEEEICQCKREKERERDRERKRDRGCLPRTTARTCERTITGMLYLWRGEDVVLELDSDVSHGHP